MDRKLLLANVLNIFEELYNDFVQRWKYKRNYRDL